MAIEKLNKTYINNQTKLNAADFQENVDKIDELVEFANTPGVYRISSPIQASSVGTEINLSNSLANYDFVLLATGSVSEGTYLHTLQMPFLANFVENQRSKAASEAWIDQRLVANTFSGKIVLTVESITKLVITSYSGSEPLRGVFGVKFY